MGENEGAEEAASSSSKKGAENKKVRFLKLFSLADGLDIALMIIGTIGAIGSGLSQPLLTVLLGDLVNSFGSNISSLSDVVHEVSKVSLKFVYLAIAGGFALLLQVSCWMVTGERQANRIRGLYLKTILRQDIAFFDTETTTGEVISRMTGDTILIQDAMGEKVGQFIQFASTFFGGFVIAFAKGWLLSLVLCACIPGLIIAGGCATLFLSKMSGRGQIAYAEAGNVLEQTVGGIRTVASFTGENLAIDKYNSKLQIAYASTVKQGLASGLGIGTAWLIILSMYGLALWYGSKLVIEKGYNGGSVFNVMLAIMMGGMSLGQTSPSLNAFAAGEAAAFKMFETVKRVPQIDAYDTQGIVLEDVKGEIEFKDVYFKYPARPDVQIFSGFSLYVPSGTTAALVGQSGSGKSTVISLLERFYDPDAGEVLIDGVNLKKMRLSWLREKIGLVSQEPILFATTIKENILYGKANASDEEIRTAIELANAANFIDKLPLELDTMVGERGTQFSVGQKQRISIARAIIKNPKVLLLDEATSALDSESERIVQDALEKAMSNRTTVVVAHRLTTIRNADLIVVLHAGKLLEQGTHTELIKDPNGTYTQLIHKQEASKPAEDTRSTDIEKLDAAIEMDDNLSQGSSQRMSLRRSISRGSSRHSFTLNFGVPSLVEIQEPQTEEKNRINVNMDMENYKKVSIKRLAYLNMPEAPQIVLGSIAACVHGTIYPIFGFLLAKSIRIMYEPPQKLRNDVRFWSIMYVGLGILALMVAPLQNYFFGVAGGKLIQRLRSLSFDKVVHKEISWFDDPKNSSGAVGARLSRDASTLRNVIGDSLALIVENMATIIAGLVISFTANWKLALVILATLPFIGLEFFVRVKFIKGFSGDAKAMYEEASQVANDAVGSIRTVASFCAEEKVMLMYKIKCEGPLKQGVRLGILSGAGLGTSNLLTYCAMALCFYIGALLVKDRQATFVDVFMVFLALTMSAVGVSQAAAMAPDVTKAKDSAASIFRFLDSKSKIDSSSNEGQTPTIIIGDIEFQHVSFKYPTRPDFQIFNDLCLTIPSGKVVALVGESGCGKSTIISLIERFYDPDHGHIYLDGVEIRNLKIIWLRHQMGLVSQEPVLFNETIWDNIAYGKQGNVNEEEIISAAKAANAHNFVSSLPRGYNTTVGERGIQLSGGQKQRIAIARAIIKDPKILLLDEATSALDAESESVVQDALNKVMINRTTVVVAHRLSTIRGADVIAVMKNGEIVEKGRHESLMKISDGVYASLVVLHSSSSE